MRRNIHFVVPKEALKVIQGESSLAEYRWGTGTARHLFCARCGITPFYVPRSNPDGYGVTFQCLDGGTVTAVEVRRFDGLNWEKCYAGSGAAIKTFSKSQGDQEAASAEAHEVSPPRCSDREMSEAAATPLWLTTAEIVGTFLLPLLLILLAAGFPNFGKNGKMPGKIQSDVGMHHDCITAPWW
jgi:hypothetical protein